MPAETVSRAEVVRAKQRFSIIGNSEALNSAIERAVKVAPIDLSVLVTGESGSGKEFFPKIIHQYGARKHKKYIAVNCGAIPEGTIDSELFGHEKGSFTGALSDRKGYFEEADGGTIFLDEVAELPLTTQARLLRVLETGEFLKVGSSKVQKTDIRVVAATNADLLKAVRAGKFREDLYYRLSTVIIQVPNLHDRGDDVLLLARKFASDFSERYMTAPIRFSEEAGELLLAYRWPGNVRQLKNIVEQLALFDSGETITRRRLIEVIPHPADTNLQVSAESHSYENEREHLWQALLTLKKEVEALRLQLSERGDVTDHHSYSPMRSIIKLDDPAFEPLAADILSEGSEKQQIIDALRRCKGSKREAAKMLEMSERTLYRRLHELDITPDKYS
ncbi:MAG: sigma-54-dependent Fis family transcriptional regulator [Bacteroidales bacterium]|nr:sigma-54-dependent Fis family transcriptional regulator [Bacteroidales bacterium]